MKNIIITFMFAALLFVGCGNKETGDMLVDPNVFGRDSIINNTAYDVILNLYKGVTNQSVNSIITEEISIKARASFKRDIFTLAPTPEITNIEKGCDSIMIRFLGVNADTTLHRPIPPRDKKSEIKYIC